MAACPACTFINADDANACEMCGASLETTLPAAAAVKACAHCTLENAADASACVACGAWWCLRCTRCVPAAVACCDVCGYPESAENDAAAAEAVADAADAEAAAPPAPSYRGVITTKHSESDHTPDHTPATITHHHHQQRACHAQVPKRPRDSR